MYLDLCTWQMDRNGLEVCISKTEKTEKSRFQKLKKSQLACFKRVFLLTYIKCITSISIVQKSPSANKVYRTVEFNN